MNVESLPLVGFDTETDRIKVGAIAAKIVCGQAASRFGIPNGKIETMLASVGDPEDRLLKLLTMVLSGEYRLTGQTLCYDLAVCAVNYPQFMPVVFELLSRGLCHDTSIREKLLNLTTTGDLNYLVMSNGAKTLIEYKLSSHVKKYLGRDRTAEKTENDSWRTNFAVLAPIPSSQWPEDAVKYALDDATDALEVTECQEVGRQNCINAIGVDPFLTESFQVMADFCLFLISCWGMATDAVEIKKIVDMLNVELAPERMKLLIETGILRPGAPARPNVKGHKAHVEGCKKKWVESGRTIECNCPIKMTNAIEPSVDTTKLRNYVEALAMSRKVHVQGCAGYVQTPAAVQTLGGSPLTPCSCPSSIKLRRTDSSQKFPEGQISVDGEFLESYAHLDPVLAEYKHRQDLQKLVTTEIPRLMVKDDNGEPIMGQVSPVVHPRFDVLKETGRTSSYADKLVPSINAQNVDPRARNGYVPRAGTLMFSCDLSYMELGTFAQTCINLFGFSHLADVINAGGDPHTWLGAQIALASDAPFQAYCSQQGVTDRTAVWQLFESYKTSPHEEHRTFFKHYRKLAKPTGLGYPGGLGAETFIAYAKGTFGVEIDLDTAKRLREIWKETVAEAVPYFEHINKNLLDPFNETPEFENPATGERSRMKLYRYQSPFGMYRAGCAYCAAANGLGLQTPSSEGAKLGLINVVRACYDPSLGSILGDDDKGPTTRPIAFIHDEILGEVRDDQYAHDRVMEVGEIMVKAMRIITPNVTPRFGAALMRRWNKDAEAVYDTNGRLIVWEPKKKEVAA